ncbi:MAG: hypothetical protein ACYCW6_15340 [Candidatus Xenobia bacterium]
MTLPARPVRPAAWKEAHARGLVQPVGRAAQVGGVAVQIPSLVADLRRTYIELSWKAPPVKVRGFLAGATLHDPLGHEIARRPELDAGTNQSEYFLAFDGLPTAATQAVLTLKPVKGEAVRLPLKIEPRIRNRGIFEIPVGASLVVLGRRFDVIAWRGGITEAAITFRLQCGAASWPVRVQAAISAHMSTASTTIISEVPCDAAGRCVGELVVEAPGDGPRVLHLEGLHGLPLDEPLRVPLGQTEVSARMEGGTLQAEVSWEDGAVMLRSPHVRIKQVELRHFTHPQLLLENGQVVEPAEIELQNRSAGTEMRVRFADHPPGTLLLRGFAVQMDPPPAIRLARV